MPGRAIDKGGPQAHLAMALIDACLADDLENVAVLMDGVGRNFGEVFWLLIVVLAGTIETIARLANKTFDEILPGLLAQFAQRTESLDAADVARQALTAWSTGDDDLVVGLDFDAELERVGPDLVLQHLLAMLGSLTRSWSSGAGVPMDEIRAGWALALGV